MMYELLYPLSHHVSWLSWLNVLRYTPFRAIMATITAMVISFFVAPWFIQKLRGKQISQIIREEGPESHFAKKGTPTMGGALILLSVLVPTVLWADVHNVFVLVTQSFLKIPALTALAPGNPPAGPVFAVAQGIVLVFFVLMIIGAWRRFHPKPA